MKRTAKQKTSRQSSVPEAIRFHKNTVVRFSHYAPWLTPESTCSELVDTLVRICFGEPEFLRPESCRRYLGLLPEFKGFAFTDYPSKRIVVANQPIRDISRALNEWIDSYLRGSEALHPILPWYALDTAMFIDSMLRGADIEPAFHPEHQGPAVTIDPVVRGENKIRFDFDSTHRRQFTNANRLGYVVARIPEGGQARLNETDNGGHIWGPGHEFVFRAGRCYLSEDWGGGRRLVFICEEPYRLDLQSAFKFPGHLEPPDDETGSSPGYAYCRNFYPVEIPAHWVVAALDQDRNRLPVPFGEPEKKLAETRESDRVQ